MGVTAAAGMAEAMPAVVVKVAEATAVGATAVAAMEEAVMAEVVPAVEMVVVTAVAMVEVTVAEATEAGATAAKATEAGVATAAVMAAGVTAVGVKVAEAIAVVVMVVAVMEEAVVAAAVTAVEYQYTGIAANVGICPGTGCIGFSRGKIITSVGHLPSPTLNTTGVKKSTLLRSYSYVEIILITLVLCHGTIDIQLVKVLPYFGKLFNVPPHDAGIHTDVSGSLQISKILYGPKTICTECR